ncbi:hypothetical protein BDN71DRAFT_1512200 [Pleurotus eryngii]|uniref:Uncharacterized protein n=1 Tax=Pleurotus eryngii TaxID=5323 RepID=A0A9P5ZMJ3_PLEER|nr:hypothetical protein BDN71DRAFT_1512200 [Pleurotus eryngii]
MSFNDFEQVVRLMPPPGTNYFKRQSETIFDNLKYQNLYGTWVSTLNWRCDIYVFVSGAAPDDPRFREKGGVITVMIVHQGLLEMPPTQGTSERTDFVQKVLASTSLSSIKQFPTTNSAAQSGDNYQYTINYQESIPLFKNHGNEVFMFDAAYKDNSTLVKTKQTGSEVTNGVQFALQYQKRVEPSTSYPLVAFSVLKFVNPAAFPVTLDFQSYEWIRPRQEVYSEVYSKKVTVDLYFS